MTKRHFMTTVLVLCAATSALAHSGVQNAAVRARMDAMSAIGESMKIVGQMARGQRAFDAEATRNAAAEIARHASEMPGLFDAEETDPKSEALPSIWENFDDFTAKASDLEKVALVVSISIQGPDDLAPAIGALGGACKACHSRYRQ